MRKRQSDLQGSGLSPALIDALRTAMARSRCVNRAVLFGSRARGDHADRSDIDLAIDAHGGDIRDWFDLLDRIEALPTLLEFDVTRLDTADDGLRTHVLNEGITVYDRHPG